jgi:hypothetical protein
MQLRFDENDRLWVPAGHHAVGGASLLHQGQPSPNGAAASG